MLKAQRRKSRFMEPPHLKMKAFLNQQATGAGIRVQKTLDEKTKNWSPKKWKIVLILFCLVSCGWTFYVMVDALSAPTEAHTTTILPLMVKPNPSIGHTLPKSRGFHIAEREYLKLKAFDLYMDSLRQSSTGRARYDSIMYYRSGLLDSIHIIEQMYLSQRK